MLFILVLLLVEWTKAQSCPAEYLRLSKQHTFCRPPNPTCQIIARGINGKKDIDTILKTHNRLRNEVATGKEKAAGGLPTASNMMQIVWDPELAAIAQKWAENCEFGHDCGDCRAVENFAVGQNVAISGYPCSKEPCDTTPDWKGIIQMFYDEVHNFDARDVEKFGPPRSGKTIGHFTQVIWARSWRTGCGFVAFKKGNQVSKLYVCNYGPAGNYNNEPIYKPGPPCTNCPINACCGSGCPGDTEFKGLCMMENNNEAPEYPKSTEGLIFFCDFSDSNEDCQRTVTGSGAKVKKTLSGNTLTIQLKGGETTEVFFDQTIQPTSKFCFRPRFRQGPARAGDQNLSKFEVNLVLDGYAINMDLTYPSNSYIPYGISLWKASEVKFSLKFSVPAGAYEHILDVKDIVAFNGDCSSRND